MHLRSVQDLEDSASTNHCCYYSKARHYYNHYNDYFLLFSVLKGVMWPFCNLLNDISLGLISEWDCVPGLLMLVGGEAM